MKWITQPARLFPRTHLGCRWFLHRQTVSSHRCSRCFSPRTSLGCGRGCWIRCSSRDSRRSLPASSWPSPPDRSWHHWRSETWCSPGSLSAGTPFLLRHTFRMHRWCGGITPCGNFKIRVRLKLNVKSTKSPVSYAAMKSRWACVLATR